MVPILLSQLYRLSSQARQRATRAGELAARLDTLDELLKVLPRDVGLDRKAVTAFKKAHAPRKPRSRRAA